MAWYAKPSGAYSRTSVEGITNIFNFRTEFSTWALESVCGMLGNVQAESGFNPWRWQGDRYGTSRGYGLFQYTPASGYLALSGVTPNLSVDSTTSGATPEDAVRQIQAFRTNELGKWVSRCWRPYWNDDGTWSGNPLYPELWALRSQVLSTWGSGSSISIAEFSEVTDMYDAAFIFLACFEGPRIPNLGARQRNAAAIYTILTGDPPPTPPTPPPPPPPPEPPAGDFNINKLLIYTQRRQRKKIRRFYNA